MNNFKIGVGSITHDVAHAIVWQQDDDMTARVGLQTGLMAARLPIVSLV